jgi:FkbM family methyltransferase
MVALSGFSMVKVLLAVMANSRPHTRPFALGLLKLLAPGPRVSFVYKFNGCKRIGFLRWKYIDSDVQVALEFVTGDWYRLSRIPQPDFIVDGGANTGLFTLAATARWPNVPIIAFEPVPENVEAIKNHIKANHIQKHVRIEPAALAGSDGNKRFFLRELCQGGFFENLPAAGTIDVRCRVLSQYFPSDPNMLKLIKLDIEGGEIEVLDELFQNGGLKKTIIVMELHTPPATREWIEELARRIGYRIEFFQFGPVTAHCQLTSPDL